MEYFEYEGLCISKLTLGTAQLRIKYGIANKHINPQSGEILKAAADSGINCFDTAPAYGDSEESIGSFLQGYPHFPLPPVVITKLPQVNLSEKLTGDNVLRLVRKHALASAARLKITSLPIYLLHHTSDMIVCNGLVMESLMLLREEGLLGRIGVSTYTEEEVEIALKMEAIEAIQVPVNLFDHRLIKTGLLNRLRDRGAMVFARSIFLQGLFMLDPERLPGGLSAADKPLRRLHELSALFGISIPQMAVAFVRDLPGITSLVIGAETPGQILQDINLLESSPLPASLIDEITHAFSNLPLKLINPSMWNLKE